jgi:hypothetical protein
MRCTEPSTRRAHLIISGITSKTHRAQLIITGITAKTHRAHLIITVITSKTRRARRIISVNTFKVLSDLATADTVENATIACSIALILSEKVLSFVCSCVVP